MSKVTITFYGHSCFKLESQGSSIVFDPYADGSVPGQNLPRGIEADIVSCSHGHADHNASNLVALTGLEPSFQVTKLTVPHDHHSGDHRGLSDITFVHLDDMVIAHLGDLGRLPTDAEYEQLAKADVVLLPCAGFYTISSAEAAEIITHLKHPCLKILMHFREAGRGYDVQESISDVAENIKDIKRLDSSSISLCPKCKMDDIITLEPVQ